MADDTYANPVTPKTFAILMKGKHTLLRFKCLDTLRSWRGVSSKLLNEDKIMVEVPWLNTLFHPYQVHAYHRVVTESFDSTTYIGALKLTLLVKSDCFYYSRS